MQRNTKLQHGVYINILPQPAPRPKIRVLKGKKKVPMAYYPAKYHTYKKTLAYKIKAMNLKQCTGSVALHAIFHLPYPKGTAKKRMIHGAPHVKKPDVDNYLKALMDSIEQSGLLSNDSRIYAISAKKLYNTGGSGIEFSIEEF